MARVIDLAGLAGAYATRLFAEHGHEVLIAVVGKLRRVVLQMFFERRRDHVAVIVGEMLGGCQLPATLVCYPTFVMRTGAELAAVLRDGSRANRVAVGAAAQDRQQSHHQQQCRGASVARGHVITSW